jgi:AbrB family looped-hinge helix DNA binding protein
VARAVVSIGRKYAVYLPRSVVEELKLKEGEKLVLTVEGESIVLRRLPDFFAEARRAPKRLRLAPEEFERASAEAQEELLGARDA